MGQLGGRQGCAPPHNPELHNRSTGMSVFAEPMHPAHRGRTLHTTSKCADGQSAQMRTHPTSCIPEVGTAERLHCTIALVGSGMAPFPECSPRRPPSHARRANEATADARKETRAVQINVGRPRSAARAFSVLSSPPLGLAAKMPLLLAALCQCLPPKSLPPTL